MDTSSSLLFPIAFLGIVDFLVFEYLSSFVSLHSLVGKLSEMKQLE